MGTILQLAAARELKILMFEKNEAFGRPLE